MMALSDTQPEHAGPAHVLLPPVNSASSLPLYLQAKSILIDAIEKGVLPAGCPLPNTGEVSRQLHVSMLTAHRALQSLAQEGWLARGQGHRTVVRDDFRAAVERKPRYRIALAVRRDGLSQNARVQRLLAGVVAAVGVLAPRVESVVCSYASAAELDTPDADGVLCICPDTSDFARLEEVSREHAVVILGASSPLTTLNCVDSDNRNGARAAIRHLLNLGHRRIAVVTGTDPSLAVRQRLDGLATELAAAGLTVPDPWTIDTWDRLRRDTQRRRLLARLAARQHPTAVFATDLASAVCTLAWIQEGGIRVPETISLVGYEDGCAAEGPGLTTVVQPLNELAVRAVARLQRLLEDRPVPQSPGVELLQDSLSVRRTTGPSVASPPCRRPSTVTV